MKINKIYCVVKKTDYQHYQKNEKRQASFSKMSSNFQKLVLEDHKNQVEFVDNFFTFAASQKLTIKQVKTDEISTISPQENDLVMSCGGDGTFLSCAQNFPKSLLLGLNSNYRPEDHYNGSKGALTRVNHQNYRQILTKIACGDLVIEHWNRLAVKINEKQIDRFAINEVYIGHEISYLTSNISVQLDQLEEYYNCSGLIASTAMGSHAWYASAGGVPFSNELDIFAFLVLLTSAKWKSKITSGIASKDKKLIVTPHRDRYILSFDSQTDIVRLNAGDRVQIFIANDPLKVVAI